MPDLSGLATHLRDTGHDGYLVDAGGNDADQRYLSGFDAPDPYISVYTPEERALLVSGLEYGRATKTSGADVVRRHADYDFQARRAEEGATAARRGMIADFLADLGVERVTVPARFPVATADGLREHGVTVTPDTEDVLTEIRAVKSDAEIDNVRAAQRANEAAMAAAEDLIAAAEIDREAGELRHEGEALTAERVKEEIEVTLLRHGCALDETLVAGGEQGADPHNRGSGPLPPDEPIVIDIFPQDKTTKYHADMTRTFCRGEPDPEVERRYELTHEALEAALDRVEPGVTGADVHDAVCDVYEDAGYATFRSDPTTETGFIHSTGHGVGLEVHELPRLSPEGGELEAGHVITVEPGLYDPAAGGMRIEDLVVVTEGGYENLTDYRKELVVA